MSKIETTADISKLSLQRRGEEDVESGAPNAQEDAESEELVEEEEEDVESGVPNAPEDAEAEELVEEEELIELVDREKEVLQVFSRKTINALYRNGIKDFNQLEIMNDEDILSLKGIGHQALDQIRSVFVYSRNQTLSQSLRKQSIAKVPELVDENVNLALEVNHLLIY